MANEVISPAEIEKFKVERLAERDFCSKLTGLVSEFRSKVSPSNSTLRSMERFLKARV